MDLLTNIIVLFGSSKIYNFMKKLYVLNNSLYEAVAENAISYGEIIIYWLK